MGGSHKEIKNGDYCVIKRESGIKRINDFLSQKTVKSRQTALEIESLLKKPFPTAGGMEVAVKTRGEYVTRAVRSAL